MTVTIKGKLLGADNKPASFVNVEFKRSGTKTIADEYGNFSIIKFFTETDSLIITGIGFAVYSREISIHKAGITDIGIIYLTYITGILAGVEILGRKLQSYKSEYSFAATKTEKRLQEIPQSISTITKEVISDRMNLRLSDVLDNTAGVSRYSGYGEYAIRGFRAENPKLINGLRTFNNSLISPMLVNIERVEVLKGPVSVLYGNADPGGTINLVTKKPLSQHAAEIEAIAGTWNNIRIQGDATGPMNKQKNLLYRMNAGYSDNKSFRKPFFAKAFQVAPSFSFVPNDKIRLNLDFSISHTNTVVDRGQPAFENDYSLQSTPASLMVTQPGDALKETNIASVLSLSYRLGKHISFNSAFLNYVTHQRLAEHGAKNYITEDSVYLYYTRRNTNAVTNNLSNYFSFQLKTGQVHHDIITGFDFIKSAVDLNNFQGELADEFGEGSGIVGTFSLRNPAYIKRHVDTYTPQEEDEENEIEADEYATKGIYVQEQLGYKKWKFIGSLRAEFYHGTGDEEFKQTALLPRLGIVYQASPLINLYATYSKGFDPFEVSATLQIFNEPFKPIYSNMFEAGAKADLFKNRMLATIALYQVHINNVAVNANDPSNPDLFVQRGEERSRGFELETQGNITGNLALSFSYGYNLTKITQSVKPEEVGNIKENAPRHTSNSLLKYTFNNTLRGISVCFGHSLASARNTPDKNLLLPGYFLLNAGLQYRWQRFTIAANLNNITNKKYVLAAYNLLNKWPGQPRNFMMRLQYSF